MGCIESTQNKIDPANPSQKSNHTYATNSTGRFSKLELKVLPTINLPKGLWFRQGGVACRIILRRNLWSTQLNELPASRHQEMQNTVPQSGKLGSEASDQPDSRILWPNQSLRLPRKRVQASWAGNFNTGRTVNWSWHYTERNCSTTTGISKNCPS